MVEGKKKYGIDRIKRRDRKREKEFHLEFQNDKKVALCNGDWVVLLEDKYVIIGKIVWFYRWRGEIKSIRLKIVVPELPGRLFFYKVYTRKTKFIAFIPEKLLDYMEYLDVMSSVEDWKEFLKELHRFVKWAISFRKEEAKLFPRDFEAWLREWRRGEERYYDRFIAYHPSTKEYLLDVEEITKVMRRKEGRHERSFKTRIRRLAKILTSDLQEKLWVEETKYKKRLRKLKALLFYRYFCELLDQFLVEECHWYDAYRKAIREARKVYVDDELFEDLRERLLTPEERSVDPLELKISFNLKHVYDMLKEAYAVKRTEPLDLSDRSREEIMKDERVPQWAKSIVQMSSSLERRLLKDFHQKAVKGNAEEFKQYLLKRFEEIYDNLVKRAREEEERKLGKETDPRLNIYLGDGLACPPPKPSDGELKTFPLDKDLVLKKVIEGKIEWEEDDEEEYYVDEKGRLVKKENSESEGSDEIREDFSVGKWITAECLPECSFLRKKRKFSAEEIVPKLIPNLVECMRNAGYSEEDVSYVIEDLINERRCGYRLVKSYVSANNLLAEKIMEIVEKLKDEGLKGDERKKVDNEGWNLLFRLYGWRDRFYDNVLRLLKWRRHIRLQCPLRFVSYLEKKLSEDEKFREFFEAFLYMYRVVKGQKYPGQDGYTNFFEDDDIIIEAREFLRELSEKGILTEKGLRENHKICMEQVEEKVWNYLEKQGASVSEIERKIKVLKKYAEYLELRDSVNDSSSIWSLTKIAKNSFSLVKSLLRDWDLIVELYKSYRKGGEIIPVVYVRKLGKMIKMFILSEEELWRMPWYRHKMYADFLGFYIFIVRFLLKHEFASEGLMELGLARPLEFKAVARKFWRHVKLVERIYNMKIGRVYGGRGFREDFFETKINLSKIVKPACYYKEELKKAA